MRHLTRFAALLDSSSQSNGISSVRKSPTTLSGGKAALVRLFHQSLLVALVYLRIIYRYWRVQHHHMLTHCRALIHLPNASDLKENINWSRIPSSKASSELCQTHSMIYSDQKQLVPFNERSAANNHSWNDTAIKGAIFSVVICCCREASVTTETYFCSFAFFGARLTQSSRYWIIVPLLKFYIISQQKWPQRRQSGVSIADLTPHQKIIAIGRIELIRVLFQEDFEWKKANLSDTLSHSSKGGLLTNRKFTVTMKKSALFKNEYLFNKNVPIVRVLTNDYYRKNTSSSLICCVHLSRLFITCIVSAFRQSHNHQQCC